MSVKIDLRGGHGGCPDQPASPPGQRRGEGEGGKVLELRRGPPKNAVVSDRMPSNLVRRGHNGIKRASPTSHEKETMVPVAWFGSRSCPSQLQFVPIGSWCAGCRRRCGLSTMAAKSSPRQRFRLADWTRRDRRPDLTQHSPRVCQERDGVRGGMGGTELELAQNNPTLWGMGCLWEVGGGKAAAGLEKAGLGPGCG